MSAQKLHLNQILAIEKGQRTKNKQDITKVYQRLEKNALLNGIIEDYRPKAEDEEAIHKENPIQLTVWQALSDAKADWVDSFDIVAARDWTNTQAKADVILDADSTNPVTLLKNVPVSFLLYFEKQLDDVYTLVKNLPTLPTDEKWEWSNESNCFISDKSITERKTTLKEPLVKFEGNDKHPPQVDVIDVQKVIGYTTKRKLSGAIPASEREELKRRVQKLQAAVKRAREAANMAEVDRQKVGDAVFGYLFEGMENYHGK